MKNKTNTLDLAYLEKIGLIEDFTDHVDSLKDKGYQGDVTAFLIRTLREEMDGTNFKPCNLPPGMKNNERHDRRDGLNFVQSMRKRLKESDRYIKKLINKLKGQQAIIEQLKAQLAAK